MVWCITEKNASTAITHLEQELGKLQTIVNKTSILQDEINVTIGRMRLSLSRARQIISQVRIQRCVVS